MLWHDKSGSCKERIFYRRPYAIKTRDILRLELLNGIRRELAQQDHDPQSKSLTSSAPLCFYSLTRSGVMNLSLQDIRPQYQDPRLTIPGSQNNYGGYGRMGGGGGYGYQPNPNSRDNFLTSLSKSMFGETSERPSRRYDGRLCCHVCR